MATNVQEFDLIQRIRVENGVPRVISTTIQVIEGGEDLLSFAINTLKQRGVYEKYSEHQTSQYIGYRLQDPKKGEKGARRYQLILLQKKDELCIALNKKIFSKSFLTLKVRMQSFNKDANDIRKTNRTDQKNRQGREPIIFSQTTLLSNLNSVSHSPLKDFVLGFFLIFPSKKNVFLTKFQESYPDVLHGEIIGEKYLNTAGKLDQSEPLIDFDWNQGDERPTPKFNISNIAKDLKAGKEYLILSENSLFPYTWEVSISSLDNLKEFLDFFIPKLMEI